MNPTSWAPAASQQIYKAFIRPKMEYGLALVPGFAHSIEPYEKTQNLALRMILGTTRNTSIMAMRKLLKIESMRLRNQTLGAQFAAKLHNSIDSSVPAIKIWWNKQRIANVPKSHMEANSIIRNTFKLNKIWKDIINWTIWIIT
jgi:hypothetical protein